MCCRLLAGLMALNSLPAPALAQAARIVGPVRVAAAPAAALPVHSWTGPASVAAPAEVGAVSLGAPAPARPAAALAESIAAAEPALRELAEPETAGSAASAAGRELEDVLT
ncbi:MAG: hypothetical protein HY403_09070, partial [Elusimicrobia bacterium]|nr:hypothetical protein [Elusimicrobiota bacterium]